jgi:cation diffusion facilitator family transporter
MAAKFWAWHLTGSAAVLSDALESIINVVAAGFTMASIIVASRPPDKTHPYGHGKMEFFAAGFEGSLIILAAVGILLEAVPKIIDPVAVPRLQVGLVVVAGAGVVNLALGAGLLWAGKHTRSLALSAEGKHVLSDVYTSVGVVLGLLLVRMTGWLWLDGVTAALVAVNILVMGVLILKSSMAGLMDRTDPELLERICALLSANRKDIWIDIHKLRAWQSGALVHIDFHVIMPRDLTFHTVHEELERMEELLADEFEGLADVIIHADPCDTDDCRTCDRDPCEWREQPPSHRPLLTPESCTEGVEDIVD